MQSQDSRQYAPSALRNRSPLLEVLRPRLPDAGMLVEIAAGSGEHAVFFAPHFPGLTWCPTDADPAAVDSIAAWIKATPAPNLGPPLRLDVNHKTWPFSRADVILCVNMIHIAPWSATEGLMRGAGRILSPGGLLITYGPYKRGGIHTAASNEAFEEWLKAQNPAFGVRDLEAVAAAAAAEGLSALEVIEMPANNFTLVFRKDAP